MRHPTILLQASIHRKSPFFVVSILALTPCPVAAYAQPAKLPCIRFLRAATATDVVDRREAFNRGLLGYEDGKSIFIEYRMRKENSIGYRSDHRALGSQYLVGGLEETCK